MSPKYFLYWTGWGGFYLIFSYSTTTPEYLVSIFLVFIDVSTCLEEPKKGHNILTNQVMKLALLHCTQTCWGFLINCSKARHGLQLIHQEVDILKQPPFSVQLTSQEIRHKWKLLNCKMEMSSIYEPICSNIKTCSHSWVLCSSDFCNIFSGGSAASGKSKCHCSGPPSPRGTARKVGEMFLVTNWSNAKPGTEHFTSLLLLSLPASS